MSGWPNEVIDAVTDAICNAQSEPHWPAAQHYANAALAALAPFVTAREAAAFQRGLEAAAAHVETVREWRGQDYYCDSCKDGAIYPDREDVAAAIRALPVPEDKA